MTLQGGLCLSPSPVVIPHRMHKFILTKAPTTEVETAHYFRPQDCGRFRCRRCGSHGPRNVLHAL